MTNLDKDIIKTKENKSSGKLLRNFVFSVIEEALINTYGENYSMRCLQSSLGVQKILNDFGIKSNIQIGSCCFSIVNGTNPYEVNWGGFWDKDHHVWLISEFFEIIDFTISKFHLHPCRKDKKELQQIPAIWWAPADISPPIFRYLPDNPLSIVDPRLEGEENENLIRYFAELDDIKTRRLNLQEKNIELKEFETLTGVQKLNEMLDNGNNWIRGSFLIQEKNIPFPDWIREKENKLLTRYS